MATPAQRGSDKVLEQLFGQSTVSHAQLQAAVGQATLAGLALKRIWWKGQPFPELIRAEAHVKPEEVTEAMNDLFRLHTNANLVTVEVFPIGVVAIEAYHLNISVDRNVNR